MMSAPSGSTVSNLAPLLMVPVTMFSVMVTDCTLPAFTSETNWL